MFETLAKLVNADKLRLDFTEYELCDEFKEALEHAQARASHSTCCFALSLTPCHPQEAHRNTKIILRVNDIGVTY